MTRGVGNGPDRRGTVQALETAFRIVEVLAERNGAGVTELSAELDVAKSTVHDHLKTLEASGYVVKSESGAYVIGLRFLDHGGRARSGLNLYRIGKPEAEKLAEETGELVNLVVEQRGLGVYVDLVRGAESVNLDTYVGKHEYLHSTAFGKAILARLPDRRVDEIIDRRGLPAETDRTVTSRSALEERLDEIDGRGYAVDREERLSGLRCVAAPIVDDDEEIVGAVSISGPTSRLHDDRIRSELADAVMRTANIIEINLTYS